MASIANILKQKARIKNPASSSFSAKFVLHAHIKIIASSAPQSPNNLLLQNIFFYSVMFSAYGSLKKKINMTDIRIHRQRNGPPLPHFHTCLNAKQKHWKLLILPVYTNPLSVSALPAIDCFCLLLIVTSSTTPCFTNTFTVN